MRIHSCRCCGAAGLDLVLDLGETALANRFLRADQLAGPEPTYPLRLVRCVACGLVQIDETVPREELFGHYLYVSATSDAVRRHAGRLADRLVEKGQLTPHDLVLEASRNDGPL